MAEIKKDALVAFEAFVVGRSHRARKRPGPWSPLSQPSSTAAFCRYGPVSVCGNWRRKRLFGFLSPRADFGVSWSVWCSRPILQIANRPQHR
jgi:hypothetical protein